MSTDVTLPRDRQPVFPNRCVGCGLPDPTETVRASGESGGWFFGWFAKKHHADAPACTLCQPALRAQTFWRAVLLWATIAAGAVVAFALLPELGVPVKKWTIVPVVVVFLIPYGAWIMFSPPAFDITVHKDTVEYEFRDAEYAAEFAKLNVAPVE